MISVITHTILFKNMKKFNNSYVIKIITYSKQYRTFIQKKLKIGSIPSICMICQCRDFCNVDITVDSDSYAKIG